MSPRRRAAPCRLRRTSRDHVRRPHHGRSAGGNRAGRSGLRRRPAYPPRVGARGAPQYAHADRNGADAHYCLGRPGRLFDQIGPVVAADDETAQALVSASLLAADGRAVVVDAFDRHSGLHRLAAQPRVHGPASAVPHAPRASGRRRARRPQRSQYDRRAGDPGPGVRLRLAKGKLTCTDRFDG